MGFFGKIMGKKQEKTNWKSPQYNEIRGWVESRIGPIDPANPQFNSKLAGLVSGEVDRITNELMQNVIITYSDGNTVLSGDTRRIRKHLRQMGFKWDMNNKSWVLQSRIIQKHEINLSTRLGGLLTYAHMVEYRVGLE